MSTRVDILAAKAESAAHQQEHGCKPAYLQPGVTPCAERVRLHRAHMDTAARWGTDPGDAAKVTAQYAWQTELLGQRVTA